MNREQTTIRLPEKLKEELRQEAQRRGVSFNEFLMILLNRYRFLHEGAQNQPHA